MKRKKGTIFGVDSKPDAELIQTNYKNESQKLYIVADAKYYHMKLNRHTIYKTLEDMEVRNARGLIICSEGATIPDAVNNYIKNSIGSDTLKIIKIFKEENEE